MKDREAEGEKAYDRPTKRHIFTIRGDGRDKIKLATVDSRAISCVAQKTQFTEVVRVNT